MKILSLLLIICLPITTFAEFGKPELIARYAGVSNWNAPITTYCFFSEPAVDRDTIYLGCLENEDYLMVKWDESGYNEVARAQEGHRFSFPLSFSGGVSWYEYDEFSTTRSFVANENDLWIEDIQKLGPVGSFQPLGENTWLYHLKKSIPELWIMSSSTTRPVFTQNVAYIFSPVVGHNGEAVTKIRKDSLSNSAPDELWSLKKGEWKKILEDSDSNPTSPWKSFRHQLAVEGDRILIFAQDQKGEVLIIHENGRIAEIARAGVHLKSFDHFSAKMKSGVVAFRGVDLKGNKAVWAYHQGKLSRLITQGDMVLTDKGYGRVHYKNEHSIFYGSPGINQKGDVVLQATLTDPDYPDTLIGVGILKFTQE
jgi:hypothetical protein